jgi:hypothetical protein
MLPDHLLLLLRESLNECEWIDGSRMAESKEHAIGRGESECPVSGPGLPQALWTRGVSDTAGSTASDVLRKVAVT